jgi:hypothetical protein
MTDVASIYAALIAERGGESALNAAQLTLLHRYAAALAEGSPTAIAALPPLLPAAVTTAPGRPQQVHVVVDQGAPPPTDDQIERIRRIAAQFPEAAEFSFRVDDLDLAADHGPAIGEPRGDGAATDGVSGEPSPKIPGDDGGRPGASLADSRAEIEAEHRRRVAVVESWGRPAPFDYMPRPDGPLGGGLTGYGAVFTGRPRHSRWDNRN